MKKYFLPISILFFLFCLNELKGQEICGRIFNAENGSPVDNATIYINGSTVGTSSDENGSFRITVKKFPTLLIVSHISFEKKIISLANQPEQEIVLKIYPGIYALEQVSVSENNRRKDNLKMFRTYFLGNDFWGRKAVIKNEDALSFLVSWDTIHIRKRKKVQIYSFEVFADEPLIIDLPELGYLLRYDLVRFRMKSDSTGWKSISSLGYRYYRSETDPKDKRNKSIVKQRLNAYYNSPQHFTRSLFDNKLKENGYRVLLVNIDSTDKKLISRSFSLEKCACISYQDDEALITGMQYNPLYVLYYGTSRGPFDLTSSYPVSVYSKKSLIYFRNQAAVIRQDGSRPENSLFFNGSLSEKRIGATLPDDYYPEK